MTQKKTPPSPPASGGSESNPFKDERFGMRIELPVPFLQKHLEDYQEALEKLTAGNMAAAVYSGAIVKAGILAGVVMGIAIEETGGLESYKIAWASKRLYGMVAVAEKVPQGAPYGLTIELPEPFLQSHLEAYQVGVLALMEEKISQAALDRAAITVGLQLGWVTGVQVAEIPGLRAGVARWAANALRGRVALANEVPLA